MQIPTAPQLQRSTTIARRHNKRPWFGWPDQVGLDLRQLGSRAGKAALAPGVADHPPNPRHAYSLAARPQALLPGADGKRLLGPFGASQMRQPCALLEAQCPPASALLSRPLRHLLCPAAEGRARWRADRVAFQPCFVTSGIPTGTRSGAVGVSGAACHTPNSKLDSTRRDETDKKRYPGANGTALSASLKS